METLQPPDLKNPWTWLRQAFPVRTFHTLEKVPDLPANVVDSSGISYTPFAWWDCQSYCWRTWQRCWIEEWARYSEVWPRSGMTRNGIAYRRPTLAPRISEIGSGYLPTPDKSLSHSPFSPRSMFQKVETGTRNSGAKIGSSLKWHPYALKFCKGGWIDPRLTEWMMGYPIDFTDLDSAEIVSYRKSRS